MNTIVTTKYSFLKAYFCVYVTWTDRRGVSLISYIKKESLIF